MKLSPAVKGFIISLAAVVAAFAIYNYFLAKQNYFVVDNPTPDTYYFKINKDGEKIITSGQTVKVDLQKGKNRIEVFDGNKKPLYDSVFTVNKMRGLLNIAHQDYYINTQYYGYNVNKDSLLQTKKINVIDGKNFYGGALKFNKLYTDDFYYNVDENYDKIIKNIDKLESRTKIFRKQDYLDYYNQYYKL